ncbi:hypothetical protein [Frateuria sp. YIM B11624]|uniref:hypothetical protein n=1 Tax=Frateuria sp. YIM B11624 TaxID=3143185 RepID=UPI003C742E5D
MEPHVLSVSLDKSTTPWSVLVDPHGHANHVYRHRKRQTLTWKLTGNAAGGALLPLQWIRQPPKGIFGEPKLDSNGKRMTMTDFNHHAESRGSWTYLLCLMLDGKRYSTAKSCPAKSPSTSRARPTAPRRTGVTGP